MGELRMTVESQACGDGSTQRENSVSVKKVDHSPRIFGMEALRAKVSGYLG